ncbi:hypothetical protein GGR56DRAFT_647232 [Xylariaceae sp. FL0804]|nr:hypothetical protein GGR56DRAFT_647232 [Xylariaceae sp. FL0804]
MQFTTFIAAAATLAFGANAAVLRRDGDRLAQFRIFGAEGCDTLNLGFGTVDESGANTCNAFTDTVLSVKLEAEYSPAADGCNFYIYTDAACSEGRRAIGTESGCNDPLNEGETWGSWEISCGTGSA